jgi:hypothetical protein
MIELDDAPQRKPRIIRESDVEERLRMRVADFGGMAEKFTSPQRAHVPDRLVSWCGGAVCFVECKAPGKPPTKMQLRDHEQRRAMGFSVYVVDSYEAIEKFLIDEGCEI